MAEPAARPRMPKFLRDLWAARRLVAAAVIIGILLWFIVGNNQPATVYLPFGLGQPSASIGVIVLASALAGSLATVLILTLVLALRRYRGPARAPAVPPEPHKDLIDELPPSDYAARTGEGFTDAPWSAR
jgi:uncharacterized integral membrane protein